MSDGACQLTERGHSRQTQKPFARLPHIDLGRDELKPEIGCGDDRYDADARVDQPFVEGAFGGERETDDGKRNACARKPGHSLAGQEACRQKNNDRIEDRGGDCIVRHGIDNEYCCGQAGQQENFRRTSGYISPDNCLQHIQALPQARPQPPEIRISGRQMRLQSYNPERPPESSSIRHRAEVIRGSRLRWPTICSSRRS
ncbi:Uncharacterised protein [Brucella abortus]|nr:Uncharacterised protein [Brucella abortus]